MMLKFSRSMLIIMCFILLLLLNVGTFYYTKNKYSSKDNCVTFNSNSNQTAASTNVYSGKITALTDNIITLQDEADNKKTNVLVNDKTIFYQAQKSTATSTSSQASTTTENGLTASSSATGQAYSPDASLNFSSLKVGQSLVIETQKENDNLIATTISIDEAAN